MTIDKKVKFTSINIALITISDSRKENDDKSGNLLKERIINFGHNIFEKIIIKDDVSTIENTILNYANQTLVDVIITTGGTGLTGRDSTPEALKNISDKQSLSFEINVYDKPLKAFYPKIFCHL